MERLLSSRNRHTGQRIDLVDAAPPCSKERIIRGLGHESSISVLIADSPRTGVEEESATPRVPRWFRRAPGDRALFPTAIRRWASGP